MRERRRDTAAAEPDGVAGGATGHADGHASGRGIDRTREAARLVQWGLRVRARPAQEPDYRRLVDLYHDDPGFRSAVRAIADGLGLRIVDVGEYGAIVAPLDDSVFALRGADFRPTSSTVEDRLLDGLIELAIAATVFPTPRDLEDHAAAGRDQPRAPARSRRLHARHAQRRGVVSADLSLPGAGPRAGGQRSAAPGARRARARTELMPQLARLRLVSIGHPSARFGDLVLDFRDPAGQATDVSSPARSS